MSYERPKHPEIDVHKTLVENIFKLKENLQTSKADKFDIIYNFFSQFIQATTSNFNAIFKEIVKEAIYTDYSNLSGREMATRIIKEHDIAWPTTFLSTKENKSRIYLSDIRNQIVFVFWSQYQHMIPAEHLPYTQPPGTEEQNKTYKKIAHVFGGRNLDPKDSERINILLEWVHHLKLIHLVMNNLEDIKSEENIDIINTCSCSWLHIYNKYGMQKLIWELFLDIWYYDNA